MNLPKMTPTRLAAALLAAGAITGAGVTAALSPIAAHATVASVAPTAAGAVSQGSTPTQAQAPVGTATPPNFAQITRQYGPAVVNISVAGTEKVAARPGADALAQLFGQLSGQIPGQLLAPQRDVPVRGEGSGFIVSPDGIILTNAHVVKGADEVTVKLTDRREYRAKVLGADPQTDIAVIKIDARNLPVVRFGDPRALEVGEWVLAIGSPFGLENTATAGIVSAKGRSLPDDSAVPFIQTDVAVNPGNSGGPLFNDRGEVVGINSQIYSRTGGYQGLSFAIPIDLANKIKDQIIATGKVEHARLGVVAQELNQALAESFKLDAPSGALVATVQPGSAAAKAGLKTGDVIRAINDHPVVSSGDLASIVGLSRPGERVTLEVWRDGSKKEIAATLGGSDDGVTVAATADAAQKARLGLALRPLSPDEQQATGTGGLLVQQATGPAAKAGIQAGDVILAVNGTAARSVDQLRAALKESGEHVALLVQRGADKLFVPVRIG